MRIRFSHNYPKLHGQTSAELLAVRYIRIDENTPRELLEYDTKYAEGCYYPLRKGEYLQLVFLGNLGIPFCTIRRAYPEGKFFYYCNAVGKSFDIEIKEAEVAK